MKKQYVLTPELKGDVYYARLPRGVETVTVCYVTQDQRVPQRVSYAARLEIGHDYQIRNGCIISRRHEVLANAFILVEIEDSFTKKCKACRRDSNPGQFCSHCGTFLF